MRNTFSMVATVAVVIFLSACNRRTVNLEYTNANDEVPQLGNLHFRFSKAIVKDSLLDRWDSTEYISFTPHIAGQFRWEHTDELVFSPSKPLSPATQFQAVINPVLLSNTAFAKIGKADHISFHTPDLKLDNADITWVIQDEASHTALPQANLTFNYPVDPNALKEKLQLLVQGQPANYNLQTLSPDNKISIRLLNISTSDKDLDLKIVIDKGLVPFGGTSGSLAKIETNSVIPSPLNLIISDLSTQHDGTEGTVKISTSQQVVAENLSSFITISPSVKFSTEVTDDGFLVHSEGFDVSKTYSITIKKGLHGRIGGTLHEQYDNNLAFGELEPSISFQNKKGVYLSGKGAQNIEVRIVNTAKIKVVISKIYENNLLEAQQYGYYPKDDRHRNGDEEGGYDDNNNSDATVGDIIFQQEIETKNLPQYGNNRLFHFNITDKLKDFKGIYHVMIRSANDYWVRDSRFISLSDIGLIAKEARDKIYVFVNSIQNTSPVQNVNVIAYGANNQVLGMASSDGDGVAAISLTRRDFAGFRPAMIIAKTADDFNYLPFSSTRVNMSRFETGGKRANSSGLDAFIYPERDIYRPGEKINFAFILRDNHWKSPGEIPVKLKFLFPNGKELKTFRKNLDEQGAAEGSIDIATSAITGSYSLELYTSNDVLLATQAFRIEDFVPDRIKVTATLDKNFLLPGETTQLQINAVNFFGPPAADRNYECEIQVKQKSFNPKKFSNYNFDLANQNSFFDKIVREGKTNDQGNAIEKYEVPDMYRNMGILQTNFFATVFDETGRPVSRNVSTDIYTQNLFLGVADDGYWYYPLNQKVEFPLVALDKDEKVLPGAQASVTVIKKEYRTVLTKSGSYFRYESQEEDKMIATSVITLKGQETVFPFIPRTPGNYELRVALPGSNNYVSKTFYSYGNWGGDNNSFEVDNEGNIDIETDKSAYDAGETAKALFKTPFPGKMLVTVETDQVVRYQYVNVDKRSASLNLQLSENEIPNAYITATLIKPHEYSDIPLTVAHGFQNLKVSGKDRKISMEIVSKPSVRSKTHQKVTVRSAPNSMITLAVVDNGVLQVSDFTTPDPYDYFYAKQALGVNAYDLYPLLFPELRNRLSSTGGDTEADMKKRVNPMPAKRFKILSYWSGLKKTNGDGKADFEFDIPEFSGQVRLMAVSFKDQRFGSKEATMIVADPVVLSTALPRFLSPKDTITVPVTISNTTASPANASAQIALSGPLQLAGSDQQTVMLPAHSENRVNFQVVALPQIGVGKVVVNVNSMKEQFSQETEISIRPSAPLQKLNGSGSITGGSAQAVNIPVNDFISSSLSYNLVVSRSPATELIKYFTSLVQYPYGCTEQTVSAAFPQLYYGDMADMLRMGASAKSSANYNVQEAIRKIKMRQLYNGGVTLWDEETVENWWVTIYAAHFLWEAKKAGYDVDKSLLETMLGYINNRLKKREIINYYYNRNQVKKIVPKEMIYGLYILSLTGRPNVSTMNYYKANPEMLSLDCKYLLAAAYALAGDKNSYRQFLPSQFSGEQSVAQTGGSFYSDIRDEALALTVLQDADPTNPQIPLMAKHVSEMLQRRYWWSTQEMAFSFIALGKIAKEAAHSTAAADVQVNGKTVGSMNGADLRLTTKQLNGTSINIATRGTGRLYYFWEAEGISASGTYKEEDNYLKVRKRFFDRFGRPLNGNTFKQNDLIIVQISLEKSYSESIDNVVITDMLPAGFEIENPRTKEIPGMEWIKDASTPDAMDVRDDRINLFVDAGNSRQYYYYAVRAVSPGLFHMGPVSADAMYKGEHHSYHGAGIIKVVQ